MSYREPPRTAARRTRSTMLAALVVGCAALIGVRVYQSRASSSSSAASPIDMLLSDPHVGGNGRSGGEPVAPPAPPRPQPVGAGRQPEVSMAPTAPGRLPGLGQQRRVAPGEPGRRAIPGEAVGAVTDGVTVFDDQFPAVAKLHPDLLGALRQASTDAAGVGVTVYVNSGWRSPAYQEQLLREAIAQYGSEKEAARWVATPNTSAHVSGDAVDIGPADATAWLSKHGARYGLCQIYRNEPWHFELRPEAFAQGCPPMYADPTYDPRMQQ